MSTETQPTTSGDGVRQKGADTLTVTDNRTGKTYEIEITDGTVRAMDFRQIKVDDDDFGLMSYDPAYGNTASCRSAITYIDGDAGILEYRGYPIEQLAEQSTYIEVAYLLVHGELPTQKQLDEWTHEITIHTFVHENVKDFMKGFRHDAVFMYAGSYVIRPKSPSSTLMSRRAGARIVPSSIGISYVRPVRLSVTVSDSDAVAVPPPSVICSSVPIALL